MSLPIPTGSIVQYLDGAARSFVAWTRRQKPLDVRTFELAGRQHDGWSIISGQDVPKDVDPGGLTKLALRDWFIENHQCVPIADSVIRLTVTNRVRKSVAIEDIRAKIVERTPALSGTRIDFDTAGASDVECIYLDLDCPQQVALLDANISEVPSKEYFRVRSVTLAREESLTFLVRGHTGSSHIRWQISIAARIGLSSKTTVQDTAGVFTVSAADPAATEYLWRWWTPPFRLIAVEEIGDEL